MTAVQNIQYAARVLAKNRTHSVLAIGMLALGIGVNTAMFSVINAVLLRESPYGNADRLVTVRQKFPQSCELRTNSSASAPISTQATCGCR